MTDPLRELIAKWRELASTWAGCDLARVTIYTICADELEAALAVVPEEPRELADVTKAMTGALRSCIAAHGPITAELIGSAVKRAIGQLAVLREAEGPQGWRPTKPEDVPGWFQIQAGSELDHLVNAVRFTPGQPSAYLHSEYDAKGLLWRWALKWFTPRPEATPQEDRS